jgi:hypothetical protein
MRQVEATNRLVAAELERRWNDALTAAQRVQCEAEEHLSRLRRELSAVERQRILRMARNRRADLECADDDTA